LTTSNIPSATVSDKSITKPKDVSCKFLKLYLDIFKSFPTTTFILIFPISILFLLIPFPNTVFEFDTNILPIFSFLESAASITTIHA